MPTLPSCRLLALALPLLLSTSACRKSDAERAAEERAEVERRIRDSNALVPYRALKLTLRAQGTGREPEAVTTLWRLVEETQGLPDRARTPEEAARILAGYAKLGPALYATKQTLRTHDEDDYPLLWTRLRPAEAATPPVPGYDAQLEHLLVGALVVALDAADKGDRLPATELTLYELSRATPQPGWPAPLRTLARAARGFSFMEARYHYAAEEELTAYLAEVEALPAEGPGLLSGHGSTAAREREGLRAAGHFLRAWNRMQLKRDERATDDVEAGLAALQRLGVENELTWWGWAFVHHRRGRHAEAASSLEALARSPHLDAGLQRELAASAAALRDAGARPGVLQEHRAAAILLSALVTRAGGPEAVLAHVVGPERAARVLAPVAWLARVRRGLAAASPAEVGREAEGAAARAWDAVRTRVRGGSARPAPP